MYTLLFRFGLALTGAPVSLRFGMARVSEGKLIVLGVLSCVGAVKFVISHRSANSPARARHGREYTQAQIVVSDDLKNDQSVIFSS
jgi:hypothetical protein